MIYRHSIEVIRGLGTFHQYSESDGKEHGYDMETGIIQWLIGVSQGM